MTDQNAKFRQALDEHHQWPCPYIFKFIVPSDNLPMLVEMLADHTINTRESKNGKYTSVTFESTMCSSKEVMGIYEKVATVPGVMSL